MLPWCLDDLCDTYILLLSFVASANEQIVQGRADRIRMTMFPEDNMEVPSTQMMHNQPTNLQRLSQPAQILKVIVSGLATYQVELVSCM